MSIPGILRQFTLIGVAAFILSTSVFAGVSNDPWLWQTIEGHEHHTPGVQVAWHGRLMVFAWSFLVPIGVIVARFHKVTARQDWPTTLDNQFWWIVHRFCQYGGVAITLAAVVLVARSPITAPAGSLPFHHLVGWSLVALSVLQVTGAWLRGSKGGPTNNHSTKGGPVLSGDHYDMTRRRIVFERLHSVGGYTILVLALATTLSGLVISQAPRWMWLLIVFWWFMLSARFVQLQRRNTYIRTYPAIWGPSPIHPGNRTSDTTKSVSIN